MDELWEALSWAQLGYHADPVGLLNAFGYYDPLIAFWERMAEVGFLRPQHRGLLIVDTTLGGLIDRMAIHQPLTAPITRMKAADLRRTRPKRPPRPTHAQAQPPLSPYPRTPRRNPTHTNQRKQNTSEA